MSRGAFHAAARIANESSSFSELAEALPAVKQGLRAHSVVLTDFATDGCPYPVAGDLRTCAPVHYFSEFFDRDPVVRASDRWKGKVVTPMDFVDPGAWRRSAAYGDYYRARDLGHVICARLNGSAYFAQGAVQIAAFRSFSDPSFDASTRRSFRSHLHVFEAASRRALRMEQQTRAHAVTSYLLEEETSRAWLVFDSHGQLAFVSRRAHANLGSVLCDEDAMAPLTARARQLAIFMMGGNIPPDDGAAHFIRTKSGEVVQVEFSARETSHGEVFVVAELAGTLPDVWERLRPFGDTYGLTPMELKVLVAIADGRSNSEIAARFHVSIGTVKVHVHRLLGKLGVDSRLQAALLYSRRRPSDPAM